MTEIFLSYAREDIGKAKLLAAALEKHGWCVFWDRSRLLPGQDVDEAIETAIDQAQCMIVGWSAAAKKSDWVKGEATLGRERNILVQLLFEEVKPPIAFLSRHVEDFSAWSGDTGHPEYQKLLAAVAKLLGPAQPAAAQPVPTIPKPVEVCKPKRAENQSYIEPEMLSLPAGSFQMGSDSGHSSQRPVHTVHLNSFALGRYPVTFAEYDCYAKATGKPFPEDNGWGRGNRPVININWQEAVDYARWLAEQTGKACRLPSEAEWEYAVRAGTGSEYYWGQANAQDYAWFDANSAGKTQPVGQKQPNPFGLYDLSGNVLEWVQDSWHEDYQGAPLDGSAWEAGDDARRVLRGGSWFVKLAWLRSAYRFGLNPVSRSISIGFRLAQG